MRILVTVENLDRVRGMFNQMSLSTSRRVITQVEQSAATILAGAEARVPVLSGELKSTLRTQIYKGGFAARIMAGYGQLARSGGRLRTTRGGTPITPGRGAYAPIIEFGSKRSKPMPFLFPALEEEKPHFLAGIDAACRGAVRDAEQV